MTESTPEPEIETETQNASEFDTEPELPELPVTPVTEQHPALEGDVQGEIEHRTPEPTDDGVFTKTFSVGAIGIADDHPWHLANAGAVVQEAIQRGLHPKGDVMLVASQEHDRGPRSKWTDLTYQVPVVPAIVDTDAGSTVTPRVIADAVAAQEETGHAGAQIVGEHGPELTSLPGGSPVEEPPREG
jgi:hypothetical protein